MDCAALDPMIEPYLDGELNADDARSIESHLAECRACAEELGLARQVSEGLAELTTLDCPDVVTARARHTVSALGGRETPIAKESQTRATAWSKRIWQVAAAVVLAAGGVIVAISQSQNSQPVDSASLHDTYTPEEATLAVKQLEWALAYVDHVTRSSMRSVGRDVIGKHVTPPMRSAVNILLALDVSKEHSIQ
jgi:predicted anti-sigma-YlaC factor YlaD